MLRLDRTITALIIINLQEGILKPEPVPFVTGFSPSYTDAPKGLAILPGNFPMPAHPQTLQLWSRRFKAAGGRSHHQTTDERLLR